MALLRATWNRPALLIDADPDMGRESVRVTVSIPLAAEMASAAHDVRRQVSQRGGTNLPPAGPLRPNLRRLALITVSIPLAAYIMLRAGAAGADHREHPVRRRDHPLQGRAL